MATMTNTAGDWSNPKYTPLELAHILQADIPEHQRVEPTEEQQKIIGYGTDPLLVVAGAGSGKTHTMTDRVIWLIANGFVKPEEVLGVTFTRKAAGELDQRINNAVEKLAQRADLELDLDPDNPGQASVSTYHSYANNLVADYGLRIGIEPDARLIGEAEAIQIVVDVVQAYDGDLSGLPMAESTLHTNVMQLASECAEHAVHPEDIRKFIHQLLQIQESLPLTKKPTVAVSDFADMLSSRIILADLVELYQAKKRELNVMDYGDLVWHASTIAQEIPEVAESERQRFKVVLLDEFQDTSHTQLKLFAGLFAANALTGVGPHPVTAVGDPNQSIYGFRGASAGQLAQFTTQFPRLAGAEDEDPTRVFEVSEQLDLTTAWRNGRKILEAANTISRPLRVEGSKFNRGPKVRLQELEAPRHAIDGEVVVNWFADDLQESEEIAELLSQRLEISRDSDRPSGNDLTAAILLRTKAGFAPIIKSLEEHGIPYEVLGIGGLLSCPEVIDVLSYLHIIADPRRNDALLRLLSGPQVRLGVADLWVLQQHAADLKRKQPSRPKDSDVSVLEDLEESSLLEAVERLPDHDFVAPSGQQFSSVGYQRLVSFRKQLQRLMNAEKGSISDLIRQIIRVSGIDIEVSVRPENSTMARQENLNSFIEVAQNFEADLTNTSSNDLLAFLAWLEDAEEHEDGLELPTPEPRPGAVQLLTLHASKGLEWDIVVIPNLNQGNFPSGRVDLWVRGASGQLPWQLRGDRNTLPQWDYQYSQDRHDWVASAVGRTNAQKKDDSIPEDFEEQVRTHAGYEERRLAYVGLTRAKQLTWASGSAWSGTTSKMNAPSEFLEELSNDESTRLGHWVDEKDIPENNPAEPQALIAMWPFDPLNGPQITHIADVGDLTRIPDTTTAEQIPPRSFPRRQLMEQAAAWVSEATPALEEIADEELREKIQWILAKRHHQPVDGLEVPQHLSTTGFVDLAADPKEFYKQRVRPMPVRPNRAARVGTQVHQWIEEYFGANRPGITGMLDIDNPEDLQDESFDEDIGIKELQQNFNDSSWAQRIPAFIETEIETSVGGITLRGKVDAIFRSGGDPAKEFDPEAHWELVDWKTGRVPHTDKDLKNKSLQLAIYRLAWSRLHNIPLENISGKFVYLAHNEERAVLDLATEEELEEILRNALDQGFVD